MFDLAALSDADLAQLHSSSAYQQLAAEEITRRNGGPYQAVESPLQVDARSRPVPAVAVTPVAVEPKPRKRGRKT
jgi:hypothetical protein